MKNTKLLMIAVALFGLAISCDKNADITQTRPLSATASIDGEDQTKTTYDDQGSGKALKVNWDANETFKAYYAGGTTPLVFTKTDGNAFVATDVPEGITESTSFTGVYGEKVTYNPTTGKYTIDYSGQDGKLENLAKYDVMSATSVTDGDGLHFPFKHKNAFLRVTLKRGNSTAGTANGQKSFSIDFISCVLNDANLEVNGLSWNEVYKSYTINVTLDTPLANNEQRVIYLTIPPLVGEYARYEGVSFKQQGYHKTVPVYNANNNKTFAAGKVYETTIDYYNGVSDEDTPAPPPPPRN